MMGNAVLMLVLAIIVSTVVVALPRASPAHATGTATLQVTPTFGHYTNRDDQQPITVRGTNFAADETVIVYWNYTGPGTGTTENTAVTNKKGFFALSFQYPLAAAGTYSIAGVGQTSQFVATTTFTLFPLLFIRSQAGGPGSITTFYGNAYAANEKVKIYWNYRGEGIGTLIATATSDATGSFIINAQIPANSPPGFYRTAGIGVTSNLVAEYTYRIYAPTLALAPLQGAANTALTLSAYGFTGGENVAIFWNNGPTPLATATTNSFGYLEPTAIIVPAGTVPGTYPVQVVGQSSNLAITNTFTVIGPSSQLSIAAGPVGVKVNITGQGYAPKETVNILWNYTGPGTGTTITSIPVGISGLFQANFTIPAISPGSYMVAAIGTSSQNVTQNAITISSGLASSPSTSPPGQSVMTSGTGFSANETVQIYWNSTTGPLLATTTADANGNIRQAITLPANAVPGANSLIGVGQTSGLSFTAPLTIDTSWGDFGFDDAHQRENTFDQDISTSNVGNLQLKWTATTASGLEDSPVYANGLVYLATEDGYLNAYNATTGTLQWQFNCQCLFHSVSAPLVDAHNGLIFFGTDGTDDEGIPSPFYALNAQTGVLQWSVILPWHMVAFPTLAFNTLYVGTSNLIGRSSVPRGACALLALDEFTGNLNWQYTVNAGVWGAVAVDMKTQTVFTGTGNPVSTVVALNASTGNLIWQYAVPQYGTDDDVSSGITIAHGLVYASSKNGSVYALKESSGAFVWSTKVGGQDISTQAVSAQRVLYIGSTSSSLYALNANKGNVLWKTHIGGNIYSSPAVANGVVYFAAFDAKIYALDANNGSLLWSYATGAKSFASPIIVNGWLYCSSSDGKLYAFSL